MLNRILAGALVLLVAACASGGRKADCTPVAEEFLSAGEVYRDCAVDRRAQHIANGMVEFNEQPVGPNGCYVAEFEVVLDTLGHPIVHTAKVVRSSNARFTEAVKIAMREGRYEPAMKEGRKVQQLVRYKDTMAWVTKSVLVERGSPPPSTPPSEAERPRC